MNDETTIQWTGQTGQKMFVHHCPECGDRMVEVERINENGFLFVWYECARAGCSGQWLEKRLFGTSAIDISTARPAHIIGIR
ncbi:MAG: hypothetical protein JW749_01405 [Sedimentisphaerales bacterium]|nr:hypothetical protein [Sedimentisphaerales bacterium]